MTAVERPYTVGPYDTTTALQVTLVGTPVPQGAIRNLGKGRPSVHANAKTLKPWRATVADAIRAAYLAGRATYPVDGPVTVTAVFTLARPAGHPKKRRTFPATRPDVDKLARAVLDAVTESGWWRDDGQCVELRAVKAFPGEHPGALDVPGLSLWLSTLT